MRPCVRLLLIILISTSFLTLAAQHQKKSVSLETLINTCTNEYPFSLNNKLKLSAYAELKGRYINHVQAFSIGFGDLGSLAFYNDNCLLKTPDGFFFMDKSGNKPVNIRSFNIALNRVFESIALLSDRNAPKDHVAFVNKMLSKKGLEPFDKLFTRHILIHYGRFNRENQQVEFYTKWLNDRQYASRSNDKPSKEDLVLKPTTPLRIVLDTVNLRGWYLKVGGYVFVEDVERDVSYASGENYSHNVSAFKLFIQKLFVETTHYVAKNREYPKPLMDKLNPTKKLSPSTDVAEINTQQKEAKVVSNVSGSQPISDNQSEQIISKANAIRRKDNLLYDSKGWIPMMIAMLRERNIKITDPAILQYLINKPYFEDIYKLLTPVEQRRVDKYNWRK